MLVGDIFSSIDTRARILSTGSNVSIKEAHQDLLGQSRPRLIAVLGVLGVVLLAAGFTVPRPTVPTKAAHTGTSQFSCIGWPRIVHVSATFKCTLSP